MTKAEQDREDHEWDCVWLDHLYSWNELFETAGYVDYAWMDTETKRVRTYAALSMLADGRWATADEIEGAADIEQPAGGQSGSMEDVLLGMVNLGELEVELFDDGELGYTLTERGRTWAELLLLEHECH